MEKMKDKTSRLISKAIEAREKAYVPYSKFPVGAALLTENGEIFTGCNIENASFGLTNCAERTAVFKAVSEGYRKFCKIAVAADTEEYIAPCGACRQVILEFGRDIELILLNKEGGFKTVKITELLPYSFVAENMQSGGQK